MSRTIPVQILDADELPIEGDPEFEITDTSYYASTVITAAVTGQPWLLHEDGFYVIRPRVAQLRYTQPDDCADWRITSIQVSGPFRVREPDTGEWRTEIRNGDLTVSWSWGESGALGKVDNELPGWLNELVERCWP